MDIRQFRAELARAFEFAGFERKKVKGSAATIWALPGREVERMFSEHAVRRPWGFLLSGSLAIDVPSFRAWLIKSFPTNQHGITRNSIVGRHIANEPDMFFAVEFDEQPPYQKWVDQIRRALAALPDTVEGLLKAEDEPQRLRLVWGAWDAPKAWNYFKAWAGGEEPNHPPPHRLSTGQIVDTPANDSP